MPITDKKTYNLGLINGWLKAVARFNDKTNNQYEFYLAPFGEEGKSLTENLDGLFNPICESYELEEIKAPEEFLMRTIIASWFFEYQEKGDSHYVLMDKGKDFSLSYDSWKEEWVQEFGDLLLQTLNATKVYNLIVGPTKSFYVCDSIEVIFETDDDVYHLHLSISD
jgi:hypothetical protein